LLKQQMKQLYTSTALIASKANASTTGTFNSISPTSDINAFLANLTGVATVLLLKMGRIATCARVFATSYTAPPLP